MNGGRAVRGSPPGRTGSVQRKSSQRHQQLSPSVLSPRAKRVRVCERSSCRQTEATEEEMMDVALHLREEETGVSMLEMQQEEEPQQEEDAMRRSLHHSLAHTSRRKLSYPERHTASAPAGSAPAGSSPEAGSRCRTHKRKAGSPLLDTSHLSQASAGGPEGPSASPDSPLSHDSTQTEDAVRSRSPVFPSSSCSAAIWVNRLDQDLLQTCRTSGFVRWSQDTHTPLQSPLSPIPPRVGGQSPVFGTTSQKDETSRDRFPGSSAPLPHSGRMEVVDSYPMKDTAPEYLVRSLEVDNKLDNRLNKGLDNRLDNRPDGHCGASSYSDTTETWDSAGVPLPCDMTLVVTDQDITPPSPVFPQEPPLSTRVRGEGDLQNIHYYWGVPFCPGGLDPDVYTQVILAQFEVQKKCLKQAQRRLLNKAPWGGAILPQLENRLSPEQRAESPQLPASRGRCVSKRCNSISCQQGAVLTDGLQARRRRQSAEEEDINRKNLEEEEDRDGKHKEEEDEDGKHLEEEEDGDGKHKEEENDVGGTQVETDCEFCPETQLSDTERVQELNVSTKDDDEPSPISPELQILRDDSAAGEEEEEQQQQQEEEQQQQAQTEEDVELKEQQGSPDVEEILPPFSRPPTVDCPLCRRPFPTNKIELHAAYCDGEAGPEPHLDVTLKPRRLRMRTVELSAEGTSDSDRVQQEKCYICHRDVSLSEYSRHTERCIQRHTSRSAVRGDLLSALQQNEGRDSDPGPSCPELQPGDVVDLRDDDDDDKQESEVFRISSSPIRTFTPISEATDCLVDFRRQRVKKRCHRRR